MPKIAFHLHFTSPYPPLPSPLPLGLSSIVDFLVLWTSLAGDNTYKNVNVNVNDNDIASGVPLCTSPLLLIFILDPVKSCLFLSLVLFPLILVQQNSCSAWTYRAPKR